MQKKSKTPKVKKAIIQEVKGKGPQKKRTSAPKTGRKPKAALKAKSKKYKAKPKAPKVKVKKRSRAKG